jgi:hypothetical protein
MEVLSVRFVTPLPLLTTPLSFSKLKHRRQKLLL